MGTKPPEHFDRYKASSYRAYNGKLADRYDSALAVRMLGVTTMDDFVLDVLGERLRDKAVLDVGCATGRLLERLAESGARSLAGTDIAPRILESARKRLSRLTPAADIRSADAETSLPWPDDEFDAVTMTGVVHHFVTPEAAFAEVRRVLRQDGLLVVVDPCFFPPVREFFNLALKVHPHEGDHYFRTPKQMASLLAECGWEVGRCERINWWAFGVVTSIGGTASAQ